MFAIQLKVAQEATYPNDHSLTNITFCMVTVLIAALVFLLLKYKLMKVDVVSSSINDPISISPVVINVSKFDSKKLANDPELMAMNRKRQAVYDKRKGL